MDIDFRPAPGKETERCSKIMKALSEAGIAIVKILYDGENDQGGHTQVETVNDSTVIDLETIPSLFAWSQGYRHRDIRNLMTDCEDIMEIALERHCPGYEIDEGSTGEFKMVVGTGEMSLTNTRRESRYDIDGDLYGGGYG